MQSVFLRQFSSLFVLFVLIFSSFSIGALAQTRPQKVDKQTKSGDGKKNQRPDPKTEEEKKQEEEEKNAEFDPDPVMVKTNIVNVDAVVYDKKSGQIITGLKRENFAIFENGVKQEITNFAMPEAPITVSLVVEYSKWTELFGAYSSRGYDPAMAEVIRPVASFLSRFIKPPNDYASVIAFDIRPTPITDFTNDPQRLRATVDLLLKNYPAFRENALFDAVKFSLVGGKADNVVLDDKRENSDSRTTDYGGMVDVTARRRAIILVASGINTFSRTGYDEVRKIIQNSGIPIYVISTGNLFYKMYEHRLPPTDGMDGSPGRLTFLQATNTMNTFAKESGGAHFPVAFPGEVSGAVESINALLRNQYSIAYDAGEKREAGKKYKLEVKVDINGDGVYEEKQYTIQHRPFYTMPKAGDDKSKK